LDHEDAKMTKNAKREAHEAREPGPRRFPGRAHSVAEAREPAPRRFPGRAHSVADAHETRKSGTMRLSECAHSIRA
jgi:hypothetical protein